MANRNRERRRPRPEALALVGLLATALLSGCAGGLFSTNEAPEAVLKAGDSTGFTGESFLFDARNSTDSDGNITLIRLELGDGTVEEFDNPDKAIVNHTYKEPGDYTVRLTVLDDGGDGDPVADTAEHNVWVNERVPVAAQVASAAPPGTSVATRANTTFNASTEADGYEVNVTVTNMAMIGASQVRLRIVDANGTELANETVDVPGGSNRTVAFAGTLDEPGVHSLEMIGLQGASRVTGTIVVRYDEAQATA